jgi:REP element-mobilizing transposase RayT
MSSKYKPGEDAIPHFITFTVVGWLDVFSREDYKRIVVNSLDYCCKNKGLQLHAWVIMTNHVHLIISTQDNKIEWLARDIKKFTSKQIFAAIQIHPQESRKDWMTNMFEFTAHDNKDNKDFKFWQSGYHPVELNTNEKLNQRLDYLHNNPVRSGLVWEAWHYKYSSAIDYYTNEKGLLPMVLI